MTTSTKFTRVTYINGRAYSYDDVPLAETTGRSEYLYVRTRYGNLIRAAYAAGQPYEQIKTEILNTEIRDFGRGYANNHHFVDGVYVVYGEIAHEINYNAIRLASARASENQKTKAVIAGVVLGAVVVGGLLAIMAMEER